MAFRALHRSSATKMELMPKDWQRAFQSAIFVFFIQLILLTFIFVALFDSGIKVPPGVDTLAARFICVILMHL